MAVSRLLSLLKVRVKRCCFVLSSLRKKTTLSLSSVLLLVFLSFVRDNCCCFCLHPACPASKVSYFQHNLVEFMSKKRKEAGHVEPSAEPGATRDPTAEPRLKTPAKISIYWMFDQLDVSPNDRRLSRQESESFFAEAIDEVSPRACAEDHWSRCDYNGDNYISLSEWCWCSGLDPGKSQVSQRQGTSVGDTVCECFCGRGYFVWKLSRWFFCQFLVVLCFEGCVSSDLVDEVWKNECFCVFVQFAPQTSVNITRPTCFVSSATNARNLVTWSLLQSRARHAIQQQSLV